MVSGLFRAAAFLGRKACSTRWNHSSASLRNAAKIAGIEICDENPSPLDSATRIENSPPGNSLGPYEAGKVTVGQLIIPKDLQDATTRVLNDFNHRHLRHSALQLTCTLFSRSSSSRNGQQSDRRSDGSDAPSPEAGSLAGKSSRPRSSGLKHPSSGLATRGCLAGTSSTSAVQYSDAASLAYVAVRMPSAYASTWRILSELSARLPSFSPSSLLDFGAGPGTAVWAASKVWPTTLRHVAAIESSTPMARLGSQLAEGVPGIPSPMRFSSLDAASRKLRGKDRSFDLVIAAYALGEINAAEDREAAIRRLWSHTKDVLVIVEAGTPSGFEMILSARNYVLRTEKKKLSRDSRKAQSQRSAPPGRWSLGSSSISTSTSDFTPVSSTKASPLAPPGMMEDGSHLPVEESPSQDPLRLGAHVVAPCPHDAGCPMDPQATGRLPSSSPSPSSWCHFVQRMQRTPSQRALKPGAHSRSLRQHEDEKFSFVVLRRGERPSALRNLVSDLAASPTLASADSDKVEAGMEVVEEQLEEEEDEEEEQDEEVEISANNAPRPAADVGGDWGRIVRPPRKRGGHVILDMCVAQQQPRVKRAQEGAEGEEEEGDEGRVAGVVGALQRHVVTKRGKEGREVYKMARSASWGDLWPSESLPRV